ncbi:MAG: response regulator [candidate division Zixibacteria bacterium]|nr:response regulator [candidate division Zixibacteria bacterium]
MAGIENKYNIVVVDDETYICSIVTEALSATDEYQIESFSNPKKALAYLEKNRVDLVLTDLVMGKYSGVDILEHAFSFHPDCIVILMTAHPTVNNAISVLRKGAYDYLVKPFKLETLKNAVQRGLKHQELARENAHLKEQVALYELAEAIDGSTSLDSILHLAVDTAKSVIGDGAVSVLIRDKKDSFPIPYLTKGEPGDSEANDFLKGTNDLCHNALLSSESQCTSKEIKDDKNQRLIRSLAAYPLVSRGEVIGLLNLIQDNRFSPLRPGQINLLSIIASKIASAIANNRLYEHLQSSYHKAIKALANSIEARDQYTRGHTDRVTVLADLIASRLNWPEEKRAELKMGCTLHDIGKIGVPDAILNKPGKLTREEQDIMRVHPLLGARIVEGIDYLQAAVPYILYHHEQYDGSGYPHGLAGDDIPIEGRLLAVADTYDAIVSRRPYRKGASPAKAIEELKKFKGKQFDPVIAEVLINAWEEGLIGQLNIYSDNEQEVLETA